MRVFVDTNLWVYRLDQREPEKSAWIGAWLRKLAVANDIVVSTQVLIELRAVVRQKFKPPLSAEDTRVALGVLAAFEVAVTDQNLVLDAHELCEAEQLSWCDALIVEAAIRSDCQLLYSEDMSHGRKFGKLSICNPFLAMTDGSP
jgi:predicted nucleic acid-binding protein